MTNFCIAVTHDLAELAESLGVEIGLSVLKNASDVSYDFIDTSSGIIQSGQLAGYDGLLVLRPTISAASLDGADRLIHVARWGVGLDDIDIEACTDRGVLVTISPDGVRRPVASAMLTLLLALSHNLVAKDRLLRDGHWNRQAHLGTGLSGRVLGMVGVGNIGREFLRLAAPLDMHHIAYDPYVEPTDADFELVELDELLATSDFVCICCPLTSETYHLIGAAQLESMKPTAALINVARGAIIDQSALVEALGNHRIRAAGLDVFEEEPLPSGDPILALDNVIVSPHSLAWTDQTLIGNGVSSCSALVDVARGRRPANLVNPRALEHPGAQARIHDMTVGH